MSIECFLQKSWSAGHIYVYINIYIYIYIYYICIYMYMYNIYGSVFGKRDLLATFHVIKYDAKYPSNAANHLKIFLIEFEICLYKHLYFLYIRNPLFPIVVFISMLWQLKVNRFYPKK